MESKSTRKFGSKTPMDFLRPESLAQLNIQKLLFAFYPHWQSWTKAQTWQRVEALAVGDRQACATNSSCKHGSHFFGTQKSRLAYLTVSGTHAHDCRPAVSTTGRNSIRVASKPICRIT